MREGQGQPIRARQPRERSSADMSRNAALLVDRGGSQGARPPTGARDD